VDRRSLELFYLSAVEVLPISDRTAETITSYDTRRVLRYEPVNHEGIVSYRGYSEGEIQGVIYASMHLYKTLRVASFQRTEESVDSAEILDELIAEEEKMRAFNQQIRSLDQNGG
jgi:hypothetical protein